MLTLKEVIRRLEETTEIRSFKVLSHQKDIRHCEILVQDKDYGWFKCVLSIDLSTNHRFAIYHVVNGDECIHMLNAYNEALNLK